MKIEFERAPRPMADYIPLNLTEQDDEKESTEKTQETTDPSDAWPTEL